VSRYAVLYGRMLSPLGRNALYCSLRYGFDISSFLSSLMNLGEVCWRHHLLHVSTSLQAEFGVIKDMVMLREDKQQCLFTSDEIETVIKSVCTELPSVFLLLFLFLFVLCCTSCTDFN